MTISCKMCGGFAATRLRTSASIAAGAAIPNLLSLAGLQPAQLGPAHCPHRQIGMRGRGGSKRAHCCTAATCYTFHVGREPASPVGHASPMVQTHGTDLPNCNSMQTSIYAEHQRSHTIILGGDCAWCVQWARGAMRSHRPLRCHYEVARAPHRSHLVWRHCIPHAGQACPDSLTQAGRVLVF